MAKRTWVHFEDESLCLEQVARLGRMPLSLEGGPFTIATLNSGVQVYIQDNKDWRVFKDLRAALGWSDKPASVVKEPMPPEFAFTYPTPQRLGPATKDTPAERAQAQQDERRARETGLTVDQVTEARRG